MGEVGTEVMVTGSTGVVMLCCKDVFTECSTERIVDDLLCAAELLAAGLEGPYAEEENGN
jgi:hypothetical protein